MDPRYTRNFLERDWQAVERLKADFWIERKAAMTPGDAIQLAEELRQYVKNVRPGWPSLAERDADLATHTRVSEALRNVSTHRPGSTPGSVS